VEAIRSIVENGMTELVCELGQEGGPRVLRVDQLFLLLLGEDQNQDPANSEQVGGQLGLLKRRLGLERRRVNTIPEEEILTNYLILVDGVRALSHTWVTQRTFFNRGGKDVFLGTQAVLLSRELGVIAESVQETYTIMDSVFLGAAERQVTPLNSAGDRGIFLGELLAWVSEFATEEGPRLIRDGGKDGVIHAFVPTIWELAKQTRGAANDAKAPAQGNATKAFHTQRVARALDELASQCERTAKLAGQIERPYDPSAAPTAGPTVTSVEPSSGNVGNHVTHITLHGTGLDAHGLRCLIGGKAAKTTWADDQKLRADINFGADGAQTAGKLPIMLQPQHGQAVDTNRAFELKDLGPPLINNVAVIENSDLVRALKGIVLSMEGDHLASASKAHLMVFRTEGKPSVIETDKLELTGSGTSTILLAGFTPGPTPARDPVTDACVWVSTPKGDNSPPYPLVGPVLEYLRGHL
jgi:hypothetical protein